MTTTADLLVAEQAALFDRGIEVEWKELGERLVAAGCLADLVLGERMVLDAGRRPGLTVQGDAPTGDASLDRALSALRQRRGRLSARQALDALRWCRIEFTERLIAREMLAVDVRRGRLGREKTIHRADRAAATALFERLLTTVAAPAEASPADVALAVIVAHAGAMAFVYRYAGADDERYRGIRGTRAWVKDINASTRDAKALPSDYPKLSGRAMSRPFAAIEVIAKATAESLDA